MLRCDFVEEEGEGVKQFSRSEDPILGTPQRLCSAALVVGACLFKSYVNKVQNLAPRFDKMKAIRGVHISVCDVHRLQYSEH
jgi:hypothetical protein